MPDGRNLLEQRANPVVKEGAAADQPPPTGLYTANKCMGPLARNTVKRASLACNCGPTASGKTRTAVALTNPATNGEEPGGQSG